MASACHYWPDTQVTLFVQMLKRLDTRDDNIVITPILIAILPFIVTISLIYCSGSNMLGYLRCKLGGGGGEGSISGIANAYIQKSMVSLFFCNMIQMRIEKI